MKSRGGKNQRREEKKKEDRRKSQKKEDANAGERKGRKSRETLFFQWFVAPEGLKVDRLAQAAGAEPSGGRDER